VATRCRQTAKIVSFLLAFVVVAYLGFKQRHLGSTVEVYFSDDTWMDWKRLFPVPYSAEYMNDPSFHDDDQM
jgi:hypothetical protein